MTTEFRLDHDLDGMDRSQWVEFKKSIVYTNKAKRHHVVFRPNSAAPTTGLPTKESDVVVIQRDRGCPWTETEMIELMRHYPDRRWASMHD